MSAQNIYYVYEYLREDLTPYYVGKGKNNRAFESHKRTNGAELRPDKKYISFVKKNITEQEAFDLEVKLIAKYGLKSDGGLLVNLLYGGQGFTPSNEFREQHSKRMMGVNKGRVLGPQSNELKQKRSAALKEWYKQVDKSAKAYNTWHTRYSHDYNKYANAISLLQTNSVRQVHKQTGFDETTLRKLRDCRHGIFDHFPELFDIAVH